MKFTTLIPTTLNDGTKVPESQLRGIVTRLSVTFGGCTVEGTVEGHWINEAGIHFEDRCLKIFSVCADHHLTVAENMVRQIGKELNQEAMYFEVQYHPEEGVRILDTK